MIYSNDFLKKNKYIMLITAVKVIPGYWKENIIGEWKAHIEMTPTKPLFVAAQMMVKHAKPSAIVGIIILLPHITMPFPNVHLLEKDFAQRKNFGMKELRSQI